MRNHRCLWLACGARGVDAVRDVVGCHRRRNVQQWSGTTRSFEQVFYANRFRLRNGKRPQELSFGQEDRCSRVVQHEGDPFRRVIEVDGQVGAASLENRKNGDDEIRGAVHAQPHERLGLHAAAHEVLGDDIRTLVHLPIRERTPFECQGWSIGRSCDLSFEQFVHGRATVSRDLAGLKGFR